MREFEYTAPARACLEALSRSDIELLARERQRDGSEIVESDAKLFAHYANVIVEEIVRRASLAVRQTRNW